MAAGTGMKGWKQMLEEHEARRYANRMRQAFTRHFGGMPDRVYVDEYGRGNAFQRWCAVAHDVFGDSMRDDVVESATMADEVRR